MRAAAFEGPGVRPGQYQEGFLTRAIERRVIQFPSVTYLGLALGSVGLSAGLHLAGRKDDSRFVAQWVPTFLLFGVYTKFVKLHGSEEGPDTSGTTSSR